jgi:hypothetical protein
MKLPATLPLLVASTMFMEQLDGTILVTALPNIAASFGQTAARLVRLTAVGNAAHGRV